MKKEIGFTTLIQFCDLTKDSVDKEFDTELWKFQFTNVADFQSFVEKTTEEAPLSIRTIDVDTNTSVVGIDEDKLEAAAKYMIFFDHRLSLEVNAEDAQRMFCKILFENTSRVVYLRKISDTGGNLKFHGEVDKRVANEFEGFFCNTKYYVHFGKATEDTFRREFTIQGPSGTLPELEELLRKLKDGELGKKLSFIRH